jgi:hypothetical protein
MKHLLELRMAILRYIRGKRINSPQPYGCFTFSDNIFFRHFWFIEDGFVEELTIIKKG